MSFANRPPHFILVSHSTQPEGDAAGPSRTLSHPSIQYHYADDPPLALLPRSSDEQVLILDYDPTGRVPPHAQSLSGPATVTGITVTDAPGTPSDESSPWNNKMFVVNTTSFERWPASGAQPGSPQTVLARFREQNAVIRQVLDYEEPKESANGTGGT
ncbi:hypothetical protein K488DRAFT_40704 [Vararia minispora EC-137]|uniref:Uncharacterized protein n=1 Tax=Vararia minispora EC-137 TaxID=1314806 RepID=A0ACB8QYP8_9AGAM|nr:hypothetical protein K488DRAFT_40704 [Vararia minispora EC-137]